MSSTFCATQTLSMSELNKNDGESISRRNCRAMNQKRVTVKIANKRKLFFEKCLFDWRLNLDAQDANRRAGLWKAYRNLNNYPLELENAKEAQTVIKGIGQKLAQRLDYAWQMFVSEFGPEPTITSVRKLRRGDCTRFDENRMTTFKPTTAISTTSTVTTASVTTSTVVSTGKKPVPVSRPAAFLTLDSSQSAFPMDVDESSLEMHDYQIVLLVDGREREISTCGHSVVTSLTRLGISFETRILPVGDFLWIARCRLTDRELTLDWVVERKRWDDLAKSIQDGRYHEQKLRLRRCGLNNVVLLVEQQDGVVLRGRINDDILHQAMANTQVQDGLVVQVSRGPDDSAHYLASLDRHLRRRFNRRHLVSSSCSVQTADHRLLSFIHLTRHSSKSQPLTARTLLAHQLTVCPGVTPFHASNVAGLYPTLSLLTAALVTHGDEQPPLLTKFGLGRTPSMNLARFFSVASSFPTLMTSSSSDILPIGNSANWSLQGHQ